MPLVLAATPIGNVDDASPRLRHLLATADVVAAEDTRRLRRLAAALGVDVTGRVVSHYDANEQARLPELVEALREGRTVLLVTDAGMPSVSDPGYRLVAAAAAEHLDVTVAPGPSAAIAALAVSGLPSDRWCFEGFLPRRAGERRARLTDLSRDPRTLVLFEAPHRLAATLDDLRDAFGAERRAVVCRELTKTYEEVRRGTLAELADWARAGVRGELTLVVAGAPDQTSYDVDGLVAEVERRVVSGMTRRDAVAAVAAESGVPRKRLYDAAVGASGRSSGGSARSKP